MRRSIVSSCVIVVVCCLLCACAVVGRNVEQPQQRRVVRDTRDCDPVRPFFQLRNITVVQPFDRPKGAICGGQCCNADTEAALRLHSQKDFASILRHNSRSLQGLLNSTATLLQNHLLDLTGQSENKTLQLFSQVYRRMSVLSRAPIGALYADIRSTINLNSSVEIKGSVLRFFTDLFPLVYHHAANNLATRDFTPDYKVCLRETFAEIQPFGDIPRQLTQSLSKSLEAMRLLLHAFETGSEVLNATDSLLTEEGGGGIKSNVECHDALMKMTYCPKCLGLEGVERPCSGYCLNVLRGCLTKYVAELDSPWNSYVEAVERLVVAVKQHNNEGGVNADAVLRALDTRISEAIMYAMEKGHDIDVRVKRTCGSTKLSDQEDAALMDLQATSAPANNTNGNNKLRQVPNLRMFSPLPIGQLQQFLTSVAKTRGFYANLADSLCRDESFAEPKDQHCWNGERIGEYTKTVVDAGLDMQKYNPEVKPSTSLQNVDPRIANLADKLRHVHQMVISSLGAAGLSESDNFMQSDSADGSGSGGGPDFSDDTDDTDARSGSGSGNGPVIVQTTYDEVQTHDTGPKRTFTSTNTAHKPATAPAPAPKSPDSGAHHVTPSLVGVATLLLLLLHWLARV